MSCLHRIWFHPWFFLTLFNCQIDPLLSCAASTDVNHAGRGNKINLPTEGCDHTCIWLGGKRSSGSSGSPRSGCVLACYCIVCGKEMAHSCTRWGNPQWPGYSLLIAFAWLSSVLARQNCTHSENLLHDWVFFSFFAYLKFRCYYCEEIAINQPGRQGGIFWQMSLGLFPSRGLYRSCFFHSFHFNLSDSSLSFFRSSVTSVIHSALQQVPVSQEFLCLDSQNLQLETSQTTYNLFIFIYFKLLAVLNSNKAGKIRSVPLCFFSWACPTIVCQVCSKFTVLTEAVLQFHWIERKRGRERFILEPKGRAVNQNHHTRS